jgi:cobalt transporter subunit CbtB
MPLETNTLTQTDASSSTFSLSDISSALILATLGLALVLISGFAGTPIVHNATHDTRHATGFPCH